MSATKARYWVWRAPAAGGQPFSLWQACDSAHEDEVVDTFHYRSEARRVARVLNQAPVTMAQQR